MTTTGSIIAASGKLGLLYAERLLAGVQAGKFARLATPGGQTLHSNHPAFIFGHLALYPQQVLAHLDQKTDEAAVPEGYEALFKHGVECRDDAEGTLYPPMKELTERFFNGYRAAIRAIESADEAAFATPNPVEGRMRELFPTIGAALNFYVGGHVQNHLGQMSAWRRAMGLPPA